MIYPPSSHNTATGLGDFFNTISGSAAWHANGMKYVAQQPTTTASYSIAANSNVRMLGFSDNAAAFNNTTSTRYEAMAMWRANNTLGQKFTPTAQTRMTGFSGNTSTLTKKQISTNIALVPKNGGWEAVRTNVVPLFG